MELNDYISLWKLELLNPAKNDVLVNIDEDKNAFLINNKQEEPKVDTFFLEPNKLIKKLMKVNQLSIKNSGVSTLGISSYAIRFTFENKEYFSPLLITNAKAKLDRVRSKIAVSKFGDLYFNPFLEKLLDLKVLDLSLESIETLLNEKGLDFTLFSNSYIGNFHPHRFIILKEIEALSKQKKWSNPLEEIFGVTTEDRFLLDLTNQQIVFSDHYQNTVIEKLKQQNVVLQGPPGTGKSDVITNAIAKATANNHKTLLIAEHQTAVNVIFEKLKEHQIHHFCAKLHHNLSAKNFVDDLKTTWQFLEKRNTTFTNSVNRSHYMIQNLQLLLDKLNAKSLFGGLDFGAFKQKYESASKHLIKTVDVLPDLDSWTNDSELLKEILILFKGNDSKLWTFLNLTNKSINQVQQDFNKAFDVVKKLGFEDALITYFDKQYKKALFVQSFFYDDQLLDRQLFVENSSKQNKFNKLLNDLKHLEDEIEIYKKEKDNWNKQLNESELFDFLNVLQSNDKFSLSNWLRKRELKKATKFDLKGAKVALKNLIHLNELEKKKVETKAKLRTLNLPDDLVSLTQIELLINKSKHISDNIFKQLIELEEKYMISLYENLNYFQTVSRFLNNYFLFQPNIEWNRFFNDYKKVKETLSGSVEKLKDVSVTSKKFIFELQEIENIDDLDTIVFASHWKFLKAKFPQLTSLEPEEIGAHLDEIIEQSIQDQKDFGQQIINNIKSTFDQAHELLQIPARKLTVEEKARKVRLRKGKSILVKQFAKSRNHLSPLELLSSEAAEWINILKPVISGSSISVAENLPFVREDFDLVLFDEASQINLSHAVGGVFRAKRVLVAGDSQQMPPSNLFNKGSKGIDLLSQSTFYWKNVDLQYHYRSHHDELIAFSNKYFYQNKLRAFPYFNAPFPIEVENVEGVYTNRQNIVEAKRIAEIINNKVNQDSFDFGLVAFSQKQLEAIFEQLESSVLDKVLDREDELLISSLEHVQGEQCDHLIISLGYAYNEEGKFLHQFGPLNQTGGHRRLNVLMSRARKRITFIRSVNENDFKISDNDGVDLLRKLMMYLSDLDHANKVGSAKEDNSFIFQSFYKEVPEALNLLSLHNVLKQRKWKIKYTF
jgi:hypothetical protein